MKSKSSSILPVLLIATLAGGLTLFFLLSLRADTDVVVAARTIALGARLTAADLTIKQVRSADALPGALASVDDAVGQVISVQRLAGDQVTSDMLGNQALSAIASGLASDHRAVAVTVSRSAGLAGIVRPGDRVTLIAVVEPPVGGPLSIGIQPTEVPTATPGLIPIVPLPPGIAPTPTPTGIEPITPFARITATGLKVLLVPQTFRYEESTTTDADGFAAVQSSQVGQTEGVIVLDVPASPVSIAGLDGPLALTLPELIALLDTQAEIYLVLEPSDGTTEAINGPGISIEQLIGAGVGGQP